MVTVKIFGTLGHDLGQTRLVLPLAGGTLADLIAQMTAQYGVKVKEELLDEAGNLDYAYGIFSAGERLSVLSAPLTDGSEVVIVSMLAGG